MRLAPDELKDFLLRRQVADERGVRRPSDADYNAPITAGLVGALIGHLNDVCGSTANRHKFIRWIFGVDTSSALWASHWYQIRLWLDPKPIDGTDPVQWGIRAECYDDARDVIRLQAAAEYDEKIAAGQLPLLPGL